VTGLGVELLRLLRLGRRARREREGELRGDLHEHGLGAHLVDEPELLGLGGAQVLPREGEIERRGDARALGHAEHAVRGRQEAELHLGQAEHRLLVVARHERVRGEGELEPSAERRAVHGRHDGLARAELPEALRELAREILGLFGHADTREKIDVRADDEGALLAAAQHDGPHVRIPPEGRERLGELLAERGPDRVERLVRVVDGHHGDLVVADLERDDGLLGLVRAHSPTSSTTAAPRPPAAQAVAKPNFPPRLLSSRSTVVTMRAPVAANG
jgi:hypothetical protein